MRIMGVDSGTLVTGFGVIDCEEGKMSLVEYGVVTADAHVVHGHVDQPESIVADAGADTLALRWQPPVLYVALGELATGGAQQLLTRHVGAAQA